MREPVTPRTREVPVFAFAINWDAVFSCCRRHYSFVRIGYHDPQGTKQALVDSGLV